MLLVGDLSQLAVERLGQGREQLYRVSHGAHIGDPTATHLCFARIALMAGDTNIIEQAVQLADDGRDLLGEVARVHGGCVPPARCDAQTRMQCIRFQWGV